MFGIVALSLNLKCIQHVNNVLSAYGKNMVHIYVYNKLVKNFTGLLFTFDCLNLKCLIAERQSKRFTYFELTHIKLYNAMSDTKESYTAAAAGCIPLLYKRNKSR